MKIPIPSYEAAAVTHLVAALFIISALSFGWALASCWWAFAIEPFSALAIEPWDH